MRDAGAPNAESPPHTRRCRRTGTGAAWLTGLLLPLTCSITEHSERRAPPVLRLRGGGGVALAGFTPGGMLNQGRQRRLARAALRANYRSGSPSGVQKKPRTTARRRAAVSLGEQSREKSRREGQRAGRTGAGRVPTARGRPLSVFPAQACDVMKALDGRCSDGELQALLTQAHENGGYSDEEWDGQYQEWPPEPEFAQNPETGQALHELQVQRLATLLAHGGAGAGNGTDTEEVGDAAGKLELPRGFLELQHLNAGGSEDTLSTCTEDSRSDDDCVTPPPAPVQDKPIPAGVKLYLSFPDPLQRVSEEEGCVQESESSTEVSSSEQERQACRQQLHIEYAADGILAADQDFQEQMRRWRAGLPNFQRPAPTALPHPDSEQDDRYDFVGSHDEAAEPFSSAEGTALGPSFRSVCPITVSKETYYSVKRNLLQLLARLAGLSIQLPVQLPVAFSGWLTGWMVASLSVVCLFSFRGSVALCATLCAFRSVDFYCLSCSRTTYYLHTHQYHTAHRLVRGEVCVPCGIASPSELPR